jgi:hypothetical protein
MKQPIWALGWLIAGFAALLAAQSSRRLTVPPWAGTAACSVAKSDGSGRRAVSLAEVPCSSEETILSCDFGSAEPIDLPIARACAGTELPAVRALPLRLARDADIALRAEWLQWSGDQSVHVVAARDVRDEDVLVARHPSRYIRLTPGAASPVTVRATELSADEAWRVPVRPGGEVIVHLATAKVRPDGYRLSGAGTQEGALEEDGLTVLSGLAPGAYDLALAYAGGRLSPRIRVDVHDGKSATVWHAAQPVGAIALSADSNTCARTTHIRLWGPQGHQSLPHHADCAQLIAGLPPGRYGVELLAVNGPVISREVEVTAQEVTSIHIVAETAAVSGRVLINGKLAEQMVVNFRRERVSTVVLPVTAGGFGGDVGEPGSYIAVLRDARRRDNAVPTAERRVTLAAGHNTLDWAIDAAAVVVNLPNWGRRDPVNLYIITTNGGEDIRLETTEEPTIRVFGLPFGKFTISATESSHPRKKLSPRVSGELTKDRPEAEVTLVLEESPVTLVLRDSRGEPVRSQEVRGEEIAPGVYAVPVLPGRPILLRLRGYAPVCRIARADSPSKSRCSPVARWRSTFRESPRFRPGRGSFQARTARCSLRSSCHKWFRPPATAWAGSSFRTSRWAIRSP